MVTAVLLTELSEDTASIAAFMCASVQCLHFTIFAGDLRMTDCDHLLGRLIHFLSLSHDVPELSSVARQ